MNRLIPTIGFIIILAQFRIGDYLNKRGELVWNLSGNSSSGIKFEKVAESAPWSQRYGLSGVAFRDRLWILGGTETLDNGRQKSDVWSSLDGITWRRELAEAPWPARWVPAVFIHQDRIWLVGGLRSVNPIVNLNDIWSSSDGVNWRLEMADAPWVARHVWATALHDHRMMILGGATDGSHYYNDVLSSLDGVNWKQETTNEPRFEKRKNLAALSFAGNLWVMGGSTLDRSRPNSTGLLNDIWRSRDGSRWERITESAPWAPRCFHDLFAYQGKMWIVGGNFGAANYGTDIWVSPDGVSWTQVVKEFPWPPRHAAAVVVFKGKVWIMGGTSSSWGTTSRNDVWTFWE